LLAALIQQNDRERDDSDRLILSKSHWNGNKCRRIEAGASAAKMWRVGR
jgi:hypothetical protein